MVGEYSDNKNFINYGRPSDESKSKQAYIISLKEDNQNRNEIMKNFNASGFSG